MGLRIKQLRDELGWTQEYLAARSKMSRSQLAMIERETRPANTLRLNAIAAALGVPPEHLFDTGSADLELSRIIQRLSDEDRATLVRLAEALAAKTDPA
jgi:transcriptional regulator with XRE-family HTH domain